MANVSLKDILKSEELRNILTIVTFIGIIIAFYITAQLAPLVKDIALVKQTNAQIEQDHQNFKAFLPNLVTKQDLGNFLDLIKK